MLTARQQALYDFIVEFRRAHGCSPSIPEIQKAFLIRSPNGVVGHLLALEAKGYIRRAKRGSRQIDLPGDECEPPPRTSLYNLPLFTQVPLAGAGAAVRAEGYISLDRSALGFDPPPGSFALRVPDNSLKAAGILAGDIAIAEPASTAEPDRVLIVRRDGKSVLVKAGKRAVAGAGPHATAQGARSQEVLGVVRTLVRQLG